MEYEFVDVTAALRGGVYLLLWRREVVYVGKTRQFWVRMYTHKNLWDRALRGSLRAKLSGKWKPMKFDGVKLLPLKEVDMDRIEREMIAKHQPKYNERLLPKQNLSLAEAGFDWTKLIKDPSRARVECDRRV